jgi:peptide-methionine (S)-S-oxide reductase
MSCAQSSRHEIKKSKKVVVQKDLDSLQTAYFASGCFWCVEAVFESVQGVEEAVSGYSGGKEQNPTYQQVSYGETGHAEAVKVYYDSSVVSFSTLVDVFFNSHDPSTLNQQGPDRGTQYRSIAFYQTPEEKEIVDEKILTLLTEKTYGTITTQVVPFDVFWEAEDYHQDYERNNPGNGYVQGVSIPRLNAFKKKMPEVLK